MILMSFQRVTLLQPKYTVWFFIKAEEKRRQEEEEFRSKKLHEEQALHEAQLKEVTFSAWVKLSQSDECKTPIIQAHLYPLSVTQHFSFIV